MSPHLYEIAEARRILGDWLLESEGEVTPELEALLASVDEDFTEKAERVALFIRERESHAAGVAIERDRLASIVARDIKAAKSLTSYLYRQMVALGKDKVNGTLVTIAIQNNSQASVKGELTQEQLEAVYADGPAIVRFVPASFELDRKAALATYKAGQPLPNGLTVEQGQHVRIR